MTLKAWTWEKSLWNTWEVKWIFITQLLPSVMEYGKGYKLWFLSQDNGQWPLSGSTQFNEMWGINHAATHHTKPTAAQEKDNPLIGSVRYWTLWNHFTKWLFSLQRLVRKKRQVCQKTLMLRGGEAIPSTKLLRGTMNRMKRPISRCQSQKLSNTWKIHLRISIIQLPVDWFLQQKWLLWDCCSDVRLKCERGYG